MLYNALARLSMSRSVVTTLWRDRNVCIIIIVIAIIIIIIIIIIFPIRSQSHRKTEQMQKFFAPNFFWRDNPNFAKADCYLSLIHI